MKNIKRYVDIDALCDATKHFGSVTQEQLKCLADTIGVKCLCEDDDDSNGDPIFCYQQMSM